MDINRKEVYTCLYTRAKLLWGRDIWSYPSAHPKRGLKMEMWIEDKEEITKDV